ncbi:MAG: response regulator [Verrucomicrobia bacterium]|nr:response regulator [Verrucomicrobiota bacterium]
MRILLVDDNANVRATIRLVLEMERHEVVEACDGLEALGLLIDHDFNLVIADCVMPWLWGILALEIKRQSPAHPAILITADIDSPRITCPALMRVVLRSWQPRPIDEDAVCMTPPDRPKDY